MKKRVFYSSLLLTLVLPLVWRQIPDYSVQWHPYSEVVYSSLWYWTLFYLYAKPMVYLMAWLNWQGQRIVKVYFVYEIILFLDFLLFYSQSEFRAVVSLVLGAYTVYQWSRD